MDSLRLVPTDSHRERADRYDPESWGSVSTPTSRPVSSKPAVSISVPGLAQLDVRIGRDVGGNTSELLVSCLPADALLQQFEIKSPYFMVLHDLAGQASRRFLMDLAARLRLAVQRLVIKKQGFGTELATLYFVDVLASNGQTVRVYGADAKADDITRNHIKRVLMERCRMCVAFAPDMSQAEQESSLISLAQTLREGQARPARLVFVPLVSSPVLAAGLAGFTRRVLMPVSVAPVQQQPVDNWFFTVACWNQIHATQNKPLNEQWLLEAQWAVNQDGVASQSDPADVGQTNASAQNNAADAVFRAFSRNLAAQMGVERVLAFDVVKLNMLATAGQMASEDEAVMKYVRGWLAHLQAFGAAVGTGKSVQECLVSFQRHQVWLRPLKSRPQVLLVVVLSAPSAAVLDWVKTACEQQEAKLPRELV